MTVLPYYEVHEGAGAPLLMVHGILSSRAQWQPNIETLKRVCSPVVVELFGHGRSPSPRDSYPYHPDGYIEAFEEIRRRLGVDHWFVCGYSLGAGLTIRYSLDNANVVAAQIFTNSTSAFADRSDAAYRQNADEVLLRFEEGGIEAIDAIPVPPKLAQRLPPDVKSALLEDCQLLDPAGVARTIAYTNGNSSVRDVLGRNTVPALLICGKHESRFQPLREHVSSNMPNLDIIDLPAGHAVNAEDPEGFNNAVMDFLARYRGS
ncbi:MAG: alpha/beta fold hydrolase [Pseudomonadales bacterium]|nr:alpha/beta fold hydrolase [Pseudomonadales bacterium]